MINRPRWEAEQAAVAYLREHLNGTGFQTAAGVIADVANAADCGPALLRAKHAPAAAIGPDEVAAALTLVGGIRRRLAEDELRLICHALARGMSWQAISVTLDLPSPIAARNRFVRLRATSSWGAPHPRAARWARQNPDRLRAAVAAVAGHAAEIDKRHLMLASPVTPDDLAGMLEDDADVVTLYWAAYAAGHHYHLSGKPPATPAERAIEALRKTVTAPLNPRKAGTT
jgi:hypothetical protein